jgi:hypothetical protein
LQSSYESLQKVRRALQRTPAHATSEASDADAGLQTQPQHVQLDCCAVRAVELLTPSVIVQEMEDAKAAADEQQRSQTADAEARQQLQRTLDDRSAALDAAQQVPPPALQSCWFVAPPVKLYAYVWQPVYLGATFDVCAAVPPNRRPTV